MKKNILLKSYIVSLLLVMFLQVSSAQSITLGNIERAMKTGDVALLSNYFGNSIDITIDQNQSTYSSTQAQMVLRDFFIKNNVRTFDFTHTGNSSASNIIFCVGHLVTASGNYKVYLYLKPQSERITILREIKIQK